VPEARESDLEDSLPDPPLPLSPPGGEEAAFPLPRRRPPRQGLQAAREGAILERAQPRTGAVVRETLATLELAEKAIQCVVRGLTVAETARELKHLGDRRAQQLVEHRARPQARDRHEGKADEARAIVAGAARRRHQDPVEEGPT
jgi:hypothetical protein